MLALLALLGCNDPTPLPYEPQPIVPGAPMAGAAEATLDLPIGTPLGGYSSRCNYLGGDSKVDNRQTAYGHAFMRSTGVHTRPWLKVLWLENGDDNLVIIKVDIIYSFDGLVTEITRQLEEATGEDLTGRVILTASHTHHAPSNWSDQIHFYLGGDKFNVENFQRFAKIATDTALTAYNQREPVAIGAAWQKDWDPDDRVFHDRRGENNDLAVWDDAPAGYGKDPYLHMLRVDRLDGSPLAMAFTFGMHGTILGGDNPLYSTDSSGAVEAAVQEQFDEPVIVMHLQGAGGDASPSGHDEGFAHIETVGEEAIAPILALWDQTPTASSPIAMETASRHIPQHHDEVRVTREGAVDWYYPPYQEDYRADDVIYDGNGDILSPLDEFNAPYGAAFCGSDAPLIPAGNIGSEIFPYVACMDVELMAGVLAGIFDINIETFPLPLPESLKAGTTATRIGPLATLNVDGEVVQEDLFAGFFPAEPTAMYSEQWRRRVRAELGYDMPLIVGYAQDHEGYFLIPEDWLVGGYEPNINIWGPLQAEHVMEGVLATGADVLATQDIREVPDPLGTWSPTVYEDKPLPTLAPDLTPEAGTLLTAPPEYLWVPNAMTVDLAVPETCPRVSCIVQMAWIGGDPGVDLPRVVLERQQGEAWVEVTDRSGRPVTDAWTDLLTAYTPDPLYPLDLQQTHYWWAAWQAVGHVNDRLGLPLGTYRVTVSGQSYLGGATTWPWPSEPYSVSSEPFEVVPAQIQIGDSGAGLQAWIDAPAQGWRLIDMDGASRGRNPAANPLTLTWTLDDGSEQQSTLNTVISGGANLLEAAPAGAVALRVDDAYGNTGSLALQ